MIALVLALVLALAGGCAWSGPIAQAPDREPGPPRLDVIWVPSESTVITAMLEAANVGPGDVVYDLGCGDGAIVITAASRYGARGVGVDIDPQRIREANANAARAGVTDRVTFLTQDLFTTDVSPATVVALYLSPAINIRLRPVLQLIPPSLAARMVPLWSSRMCDWPSTRVFPLPMDLTGLLRINLRGREREGIVAPGAEYSGLCAELEAFFRSLGDDRTGAAIVADIKRAYSESPPEATHRDGQPDLVLKWREIRSRDVSRLRSSALPTFTCDVPRYLPSGRSGNHRPLGWFVATGPGIAAGRRLETCDIVDLAPTARQGLGLEPDPQLHGRPLPLSG